MGIVDSIIKKQQGLELTYQELYALVMGYVECQVPDYQVAAFLMAVVFNGMTPKETAELTDIMLHSGDVADLSALPGVKVDKHSTGGVGDTTTLILAPLVAACGGTVAKMSGRGLGHTGGTIDKLESIPGLVVEQPIPRFIEIVQKLGVAVIGQSGNLVPADKKLYALRDVTGTVGSIPLIASSIMSKKLAAGTDAIVLDVKTGSGAFMRTLEEARTLSRRMVDIGKHLGRQCVAVITDMNQPLGLCVGNALEVKEAVEVLSGITPLTDPLVEVSLLLGSNMLILSGLADNEESAKGMLISAIKDGRGLDKLQQMVREMGGDASYICPERIGELCRVKRTVPIYPKEDGYIASMEAVKIGAASQMLGAGRAKKEDSIDPAVGLVMHKRVGDRVSLKEPLCTFYVNDESRLTEAIDCFYSAFTFSREQPEKAPLVYDVIR